MEKSNNIIIGIFVTAVTIIVTAVVTPLGAYIKDKIFPAKYYYQCKIINAGKPLPQLHILLDNKDTAITKTDGKFSFYDIPKGRHNYMVFFHNQSYPFEFIAGDKEPTEDSPKDLSECLIPDSSISTSTKRMANLITQRSEITPKEVNIVKTPPPPPPTQVATVAPVQPTPAHHIADRPIDVNTILDTISVRVKKDLSDKRGSQIAYHYFIAGPKEYLDLIKEVRYTRNHKSFPEYSKQTYIPADNRDDNFDFKGYQWGYISTIYITIELKTGGISRKEIKTIAYEN